MEHHSGYVPASAPWCGMPYGRNSYHINHTAPQGRFSHLADLHKRRTDEQLQELLAERLAECRAKPGWLDAVEKTWNEVRRSDR